MPRTRSTFLVLALAAALLLLPALPAFAASPQAAPTSWLAWLEHWLASTWNAPSDAAHAASTVETVPSLDPDGIAGSPELSSPPAGTDGSGTTSNGETVPGLDPDG